MNTPNAVFSLKNYIFDQVKIDLSSLAERKSLGIDFTPEGVYNAQTGEYSLLFGFNAFPEEEKGSSIVSVRCAAIYEFPAKPTAAEIPEFFFVNSIAILFPYIRAFVSTVTLQANLIPPIILPTLNLTSLGQQLKENTRFM